MMHKAKEKDYLANVVNTLLRANATSLVYGDMKAWDNTKKKNRVRFSPRGKTLDSIMKREAEKNWGSLAVDFTLYATGLGSVSTGGVDLPIDKTKEVL